jgi:DNA (cytosine-5)-methyltransferase 1
MITKNTNEYFRYTLKDLEENSSKKLFNYITFFAGGGGSSCAYKLMGGDCRYMNEFQERHVETYLQNFPNTVHECRDIKEVTGKGIMELTGLGVGEIDILDASPPCPPFSMAGSKRSGWNKEKMAYGMKQKNIEDLTWEVIRITGELKPKVVICENVKGLTMEFAIDHLIKMIDDFEAEGYTAVYKVMNAAQHGVPQKRERTFILAVRNDVMDDIGMPWMVLGSIFPEPSNVEWTVEDAIKDLEDDEQNIIDAEHLENVMRKSSKAPWVFGFDTHPDWPNSGPCSGTKNLINKEKVVSIGDSIVRPWFKEQIAMGVIKPEEERNSYFGSRIVPWNQAAHTLTEQGCQPKFMGGIHFHPNGRRIYTPKEMQRIMTLPDDYKSTGDYDDKGSRIGLMVAPLCLRSLVARVQENILNTYNNKEKWSV